MNSINQVTLTISILVSLIFFLSVLIETIPSTSLAMPLLGKYLVFTMILITVSVCVTVCVLNIHFRTPSTHSMAPWVKRWCIDILPKYLFLNVTQCQNGDTNVLPEQLIYSHNSAYASSQSVRANQNQKLAEQTKFSPTNHSHGSRGQNKGQPLGPANGQNHQAANHMANLPKQLDPSSLETDISQVVVGPSSLFLPYLQSEAARRLQLQRSRSSDKDNKSASECCPKPVTDRCTECDPKRLGIPSNSALENGIRVGERLQVATKCEGPKCGKPHREAKRVRLQRKSSFWSMFGSKSPKVPDGSTKSDDSDGENGGFDDEIARSNARTNRRQETSSSSEHDYQHHNHFQARASVCSTNLWRIGPTRRCSVAVPANYPTYYRPLALGQGQQTQSGYTVQGHYHTSPINGECSQFQGQAAAVSPQPKCAVGALVKAATSNLTLGPMQQQFNCNGTVPSMVKTHNTQADSIFGLQFGPPGPQELRSLRGQNMIDNRVLPYSAAHHQAMAYATGSQQAMPTPPPPPPLDAGLQQVASAGSNFSSLRRQQPMLVPQGQMGSHILSGPYLLEDHCAQERQKTLSAGERTKLDNYATCRPRSDLWNTNYMQQISGQSSSSNEIGSRVRLNGNPSLVSLSHPNREAQIGASSQFSQFAAPAQMQYQTPIGQAMPRSRSTDHRLCMNARQAGSLYCSSDDALRQQQPIFNALLQNGPNLLEHQRGQQADMSPTQTQISIGRALGQAYVHRLHRQPAIYSLQAASQRPSRPIQRAYLMPLSDQQQSRNQEGLRRSRSQTSLGRQCASIECLHCKALPRADGSSVHEQSSNGLQQTVACDCDMRRRLNSTGCRPQTAAAGSNTQQRSLNPCAVQTKSLAPNCQETKRCEHGEAQPFDRRIGGQPVTRHPPPLTTLGLMQLIGEVDKAIQNAMFIAQHIDNLDEFESVSLSLGNFNFL